MKVTQSWTRNIPTSTSGYSITVSTTYSSFNPTEIDNIEKKLPKGMIIMDTDKPNRLYLPDAIRKETNNDNET